MKYFLDSEFLEGPQKEKFPISLFRKQTPSTIDLISIGIVSEDGREYYAISKDFNLEEAWNRYQMREAHGDFRNAFPDGVKEYWIRENVLLPIWRDLFFKADGEHSMLSNSQTETFYQDVFAGKYDQYFTYKSMQALIRKYGKTNKEIAKEVRNFVYNENRKEGGQLVRGSFIPNKYPEPDFYAYYADYDWVAFCWLFGNMMDLPNGFPIYCRDLKQYLDDTVKRYMPLEKKFFSTKPVSFQNALERFKDHPDYPNQENEHDALADARWNKKLYEFLKLL